MLLTIKYFGMLGEITQCSEERLPCTEKSISELLEVLFVKYPMLKGKDFQVAQNQILVSKEIAITGSEIALLPPFAGG